jgi:hypothetical protein
MDKQPTTQTQVEATPFAYAYRYKGMTGDVIRFSDGKEINGSKPIEAIPLYTQPPRTEAVVEGEMLEHGAKAMVAADDSHIQGFLFEPYHVIHDVTKPWDQQELHRTIFHKENEERYEIERAKVKLRAALQAMGMEVR